MKQLIIAILIALALPAGAQVIGRTNVQANVSLAWDASPGTNIALYTVYYGVASGTYTNKVVVNGNTLTATVSNLVRGATYYFVATASDTSGLESDYSNEVSYRVPSLPVKPTLRLSLLMNGAQKIIGVTGEPYSTYTVEAAPDPLASWREINTVTADGTGKAEAVDTNELAARFYRVSI